MFAKTVCKPGSYLCIVPVGLLTTLQYNARGVIEKMFIGYSDDKVEASKDVLDMVKKSKLIPLSIPTKGGTTWVEGVFYTSKKFENSGILPDCVKDSMLSDMQKNISSYTFYAGRVESLAASFKAVMSMMNWLKMSSFHVLPIFMIPARLTDEAFIQLVNTERFPFEFPLLSGYMIYEGIDFRYHPLNLIQYVVKSVDKFKDEQGYIKGTILDIDGNKHILQYSDIVSKGVSKGSTLVTETNGKLLYSNTKSSIQGKAKLTCDVCGNTFICPDSGPVCCTDPHCVSHLYPNVVKFLSVLDLPTLSHDKFIKYLTKHQVTCLTDVMLLPEYKECKISVTLTKLLQSVVPVDICSDISILSKLAATSENSVKTFRYFVENPLRLQTEIGSGSVMVTRLINWLADPYNATTIFTLIDSPQFNIVETDRKFDGAPIFRGKTIAITGKFRHGDAAEIVSILSSYSAEVLIDIESTADCLVIGDLRENIDGRSIQIARENNIPTFYESDFFSKYQIDEDIAANLL